jgi:hypothetical protein
VLACEAAAWQGWLKQTIQLGTCAQSVMPDSREGHQCNPFGAKGGTELPHTTSRETGGCNSKSGASHQKTRVRHTGEDG